MAALAVAVLAGQRLSAQDLDPTVEVSRSYEGKLMEVHKPVLKMAVPDSVTRFDLDFDYSVFESPYKGSYEFSPYAMDMRPSASVEKRNNLYLKAGAGYTFHPVLDLVWSPNTGKRLSMDVYARHRSYIGRYYGFGQSPADVSGDWKGRDMSSVAGADFHLDWKKTALDFGAGYYGLHRQDKVAQSGYNAVDAYAKVTSKASWPEHPLYDISVRYRYGADVMSVAQAGADRLRGHDFRLDGSFAPAVSGMHAFLLDMSVELDSASGIVDAFVGEVALVPHYVLRYKRFSLDAGVRISKIMHGDGELTVYRTQEQVVYPDVTVRYDVIKDAMRIWLRAGGGNRINTWASLLEGNRHLMLASSIGNNPLLDITVESVSLVAGLEGRISSRFSYDLRGGYVNYRNALLDAVDDDMTMAGVGYAPYQKWFAALEWRWKAERITFDGSVDFCRALGDAFDGNDGGWLLRPAALVGDVAFEYNFRKRVFAGVDCRFSTARTGHYTVPGYADLGICAEYRFGSRFSVWLRGGNLLDMPVQYSPLYAEKGVNFTAGICLNL